VGTTIALAVPAFVLATNLPDERVANDVTLLIIAFDEFVDR
jgi:hypothetical protein